MKILNPELEETLKTDKTFALELGAAGKSKIGFSLDIVEMEGVDILADLNEPLHLIPDNRVEYIFSNHVLEHVEQFIPLLSELHRITTPGGTIETVVPHFSNPFYFSDPTHKRFFGLYTMYYFVAMDDQPAFRKVPDFYTDLRFRVEKIHIEFYRSSRLDKLIVPFFEKWVNSSLYRQHIYERRFSNFFHANQIRYIIKPVK